MAVQQSIQPLGLSYVQAFTAAHRSRGPFEDAFEREIRCEDIQFPAVLVDPRPGDWLAGKRVYPEVGYSVQYGGLGYYADFHAMDEAAQQRRLTEEEKREWSELRAYWEREATGVLCNTSFSDSVKERLPEPYRGDRDLSLPAYPLYRMAGLQLDYGKLLRYGLNGLRREVTAHEHAASPGSKNFYLAALASIARVERCLRYYRDRAGKLESTPCLAMANTLNELLEGPPERFHSALQLILLISTLTGTINFGRLDVVLGPFLCRDLERGTLSETHALRLMQNFYKILEEEILHFDARIIIGGRGRPNEKEADRFALLAMETTASLSLPMPQVTLRFYQGQNPNLLRRAYEVIAMGKTFPMLYNDDVNIPAVQTAMRIDQETAEQYVPFGCGEYTVNHSGCGSPNSIINLLRCLESALNHGRCLRTGIRIGPDIGGLEDYIDFESLWRAYDETCRYFIDALALAQSAIYKVTGKACPFSLISLLYDDCLDRGKSIFDGGIRILGGTNETYGNSNTADALLAIQSLLFDQHLCTATDLLNALRENWKGHTALQTHCRAVPKFGNDNDRADEMALRVHRHVCKRTIEAGWKTDLDHFLVVVINNNHNTLWGKWTSASVDGRLNGAPLAPGNAAGAGCDQSGLTAVLNSQAKPDPHLHAGTVQNVRLSAAFPRREPELYRAIFDTYFSRGGTQAMITVTSRKDLEAALDRPGEYANLLVRVGGFSARFIDLDPDTQREIISRTEHG